MKQADYETIKEYLEAHPSKDSSVILEEAKEKFTAIANHETIISIVLIWFSDKVKKVRNPYKRPPDFYYRNYQKQVKANSLQGNGEITVIKNMALQFGVHPAMMAKFILNRYVELDLSSITSKFVVTGILTFFVFV